jgi:hypothetical protein
MKKIVIPALCIFLILTVVHISAAQTRGKSDSDTTRKVKKGAGYSRKTIITFDQNGKPHEEIVESFEGDADLQDLLDNDFDIDMPDLPDFEGMIPDISLHFPPDFQVDSLGDNSFSFRIGDFEHFGAEMEALMKERFKSFGPQFEEGIARMEEQLRNMDLSMLDQLKRMNDSWEKDLSDIDESMDLDFKSLEELEKLEGLDELRELEHLKNIEGLKKLDGLAESMGHVDADLAFMKEQIKAFEEAAQDELIKDGYLDNGETVESIEWNDDSIKFNGKKIKPEHEKKYRALKTKYIKSQWRRGRPE